MNSSGGRECVGRGERWRNKSWQERRDRKVGFVKEGGRENQANPQGMSRSEELEKEGSKRLEREGSKSDEGKWAEDRGGVTNFGQHWSHGLVSINPAVHSSKMSTTCAAARLTSWSDHFHGIIISNRKWSLERRKCRNEGQILKWNKLRSQTQEPENQVKVSRPQKFKS